MTESSSLIALFLSSLLGATLLPGGSEIVLFALLKSYPDALYLALLLATLGNTIGGMISFGMGRMLPPNKSLKHIEKVQRYGTPVLLLAWTPLLGDALCLAAGWLRLSWWQAALFMALGKFARYWVIALVAS
ncbi:MAG: DedA family protein [Sideroxydans sp.]|nr:DedA family protein [Sideroxydans sp.]